MPDQGSIGATLNPSTNPSNTTGESGTSGSATSGSAASPSTHLSRASEPTAPTFRLKEDFKTGRWIEKTLERVNHHVERLTKFPDENAQQEWKEIYGDGFKAELLAFEAAVWDLQSKEIFWRYILWNHTGLLQNRPPDEDDVYIERGDEATQRLKKAFDAYVILVARLLTITNKADEMPSDPIWQIKSRCCDEIVWAARKRLILIGSKVDPERLESFPDEQRRFFVAWSDVPALDDDAETVNDDTDTVMTRSDSDDGTEGGYD